MCVKLLTVNTARWASLICLHSYTIDVYRKYLYIMSDVWFTRTSHKMTSFAILIHLCVSIF